MNYQKFQEDTNLTSTYPNRETDIIYPTLGLVGESDELFEVVTNGDLDNITKEAGDVLFYLARLNMKCGTNLEEKFEYISSIKVMPNYDINEHALVVMTSACKVSEQVKKFIRDDNGILSDTRKERIRELLLQIFSSIACIALLLGSSVSEYMAENNKKLLDRQNRGVINGSGNDR